ncbi:site-specific integrase [Oceanobacillus sp. J11TS1]|uniref:tyrosine-type recombinase/integrase n=1 Tax=Oceanobacillus sp. J11TS1 TaxID=2807191 RepID=UPI001B2DB152|nr:site-specific integrase [Oceanobacillus sp. J11TS1]GIO25294.1 hypothetical protein J11TS1_38750 [Oceanobacillus sp. J11TS1]
MRNPNGYGGVVKLSGNRRKPYAARVTDGYDENGKQLYKYLGTYASQAKANEALVHYNNNPYDIDKRKITFKGMYELFYHDKFKNTSESEKKSSKIAYKQGFDHSKSIHNKKFKDLKKSHLQDVIDSCKYGDSTKANILKTYNQMYKFAMENDIVEKSYAQFVTIKKTGQKTDREPFTEEEIQKLWDNINTVDNIDTVLIMIYTGLRPGELVEIKNENIHLEERYMIGGFKTEAGTNRIIPIHKKILPLIANRMDEGSKYLIHNRSKQRMTYKNYRENYWLKIMKKLQMEHHRAHDCRHTFATMMDNIDVNRTAVKKILGHALDDITEKVYTHKNIEQLIKAIDKLE